MRKMNRTVVAGLLLALGPLFAGCGLDFASSSSGSSGSSTTAGTSNATTSNPSTAAQFNSQFLSSSPDNAEPKSVDTLDLGKLPETENAFDAQLGN